jgi:hypothetical protein
MKLQLKRSNVLASGGAKEPTAAQLEYGELAINYNKDDPAIFLKDSNNNVIRISGVNNIADDGQVELPESSTPPANPLPGNLWFNSEDGRLYIYYKDPDTEQWVDASPDSWDPTSYPNLADDTAQAGTLDDRYLMLNTANNPVTGAVNINNKINLATDGSGDFDANVTANRFIGPLTGNVTGNVTGTITGNADTATRALDADNADKLGNQTPAYYRNATNINAGTLNDDRLPATISSNITGSSASCTGNSATATTATNIDRKQITTSNNSAYRILLGDPSNNAGPSQAKVVTDASRCYYNPNTNVLAGIARFTGKSDTAGDADDSAKLNGQNAAYYRNATNINAGTLSDARLPNTISSDITGTAADSDKLSGQVRTDAASGDTVVSRTANADVNVRLIRSNFGNQATISGGMVFRVNDSSDNYLRTCNDTAAIRTFLNVPTRTGGNASGTWGISITGSAGSATNATNCRIDHDTGNAWHRIVMIDDGKDSASNNRLKTDSASTIAINPSTNQVRATTFVGALSGNATSATNAGKLDNIDSTAFLRSNTSDQFTSGTLRFNDNCVLGMGSGTDAELFCNGSHLYLDLNSGIGNFYIRDGTTTRFTFDDAGSFTATANITAYSDISLKENIETIPNALDKVLALRGVEYNRIDLEEKPRQIGVIAQEIEEVIPEVVLTDEEGIKSVAYGNLVGLLIESVKELKAEVNELKAKLEG